MLQVNILQLTQEFLWCSQGIPIALAPSHGEDLRRLDIHDVVGKLAAIKVQPHVAAGYLGYCGRADLVSVEGVDSLQLHAVLELMLGILDRKHK